MHDHNTITTPQGHLDSCPRRSLFIGVLGATVTDIGPWYQSLRKPDWQPPDWLFGPAWTVIFALAGVAGYKAWLRARTQSDREWIIILFAANSFLNVLWSLLLFAWKRPKWVDRNRIPLGVCYCPDFRAETLHDNRAGCLYPTPPG
ncbi:MAG: TspO/MBR family protein [Hyphomicrobiales bacterium]|nr:TspO/MBR family protein [Hyphomicrobiales bacterium]